jgi:hypothetical protein
MPAIDITSGSGTHITGLTVGVGTRIYTSGGPWHPHGVSGGTDDTYGWQLSLDGVTWSAAIRGTGDPLLPTSTHDRPTWSDGRAELDSTHQAIDWHPTQTDVYVRVPDSVWSDNTGSLSYNINTFGDYCAYGVEPNPSATVVTTITAAVVDVAIAVLGGGALAILAFDTMIGAPLLLGDLCSGPPPALPTYTDADFIPGTQIWSPGSFDKRLQSLKGAIWGVYCQCVPASGGDPPPVIYPPPHLPDDSPGVGLPRAPILCSNDDICSTLNLMMRQLDSINNQLAYARRDITLIQRQGVPFGYVSGASHGPFTGSGDFAVADILGLAVSFSSLPPPTDTAPADPSTFHSIGKVTVGTAAGWERSYMPTHSPYLILPVSGAITKVGYGFRDGVTATITELLREP